MRRIVVVGAAAEALNALQLCFGGHEVHEATDLETALEFDSSPPFEYLFVDIGAFAEEPLTDYRDYRRALYPLWRAYPAVRIVVMAASDRIRDTVRAVKAGASDYVTYPITTEEVQLVRDNLDEEQRTQGELDYLRDQVLGGDDSDLIQSSSPVMQAVLAKARKVAQTNSTVLLTGETGTGKNVVASLIHRRSERSDKQFISVHCGAIPDNLLESELFGHERGAFTGAIRRKLGKFEIAHTGSLLLDEIGTITPSTQIKLLQVLQDQTVQRVGGEQLVDVDVRILAATNADLEQAVADGSFRKDLYYRLRIFPIEIPPLRQRREDIPTLVQHFLERLNQLYARDIDEVHPLVLEAFDRYAWPGNVRELEGLLERAYILENSSTLTPDNLPDELFGRDEAVTKVPVSSDETLRAVRQRVVADAERLYLKQLLDEHAGRIDGTAEAAGISVRQLHNLMKKHGLRKERFRRSRRRRGAHSKPSPLRGR